ncbi:Serine/threonine-protein kinase/endoribonuclease IRE1 [Smittium mucronatum]|uniref:non-specific serine/threonine protein kinase n=1 Tax=Smittium mucronatum TaxID=133383 RepID=A0A1R0H1S1_9FUNG|nr:Serine/threonine-protein kinase/endoribonuclease IRE1 [Smittium mucronatum]
MIGNSTKSYLVAFFLLILDLINPLQALNSYSKQNEIFTKKFKSYGSDSKNIDNTYSQVVLPSNQNSLSIAHNPKAELALEILNSFNNVHSVGIIIVLGVDGSIHGLCKDTGKVLWSQYNALKSNRPSIWDKYIVYSRSDLNLEFEEGNRFFNYTDSSDKDFMKSQNYEKERLLDFYEDEEEEWLLENGLDWSTDPESLKFMMYEWQNNVCKRKGNNPINYQRSVSEIHQNNWFVAEPSENGRLYMFDQEKKLLKLPLTIQDLVTFSPVKSLNKLFFGNKLTRFLNFNIFDGNITSVLDVDSLDFGSKRKYSKNSLESQRSSVQISETSFKVKIYSEDSEDSTFAPDFDPESMNVKLEWDLGFKRLDTTHSSDSLDLAMVMDEVIIRNESPSNPNSVLINHQTKIVNTVDGHISLLRAKDGVPLWLTSLNTTVIGVFDVFNITHDTSIRPKDPPKYQNGIGSIDDVYNSNPKLESQNGKSHTYLEWKLMLQKRDLSPTKQQERFLTQNNILSILKNGGIAMDSHFLTKKNKIYLNLPSNPNHAPLSYEYDSAKLEGILRTSKFTNLLDWLREGIWDVTIPNNDVNSKNDSGISIIPNSDQNKFEYSDQNRKSKLFHDPFKNHSIGQVHIGKMDSSLFALSDELFPILSELELESLKLAVTSNFGNSNKSFPNSSKFNSQNSDVNHIDSKSKALIIYNSELTGRETLEVCSCKDKNCFPMCLVGSHQYYLDGLSNSLIPSSGRNSNKNYLGVSNFVSDNESYSKKKSVSPNLPHRVGHLNHNLLKPSNGYSIHDNENGNEDVFIYDPESNDFKIIHPTQKEEKKKIHISRSPEKNSIKLIDEKPYNFSKIPKYNYNHPLDIKKASKCGNIGLFKRLKSAIFSFYLLICHVLYVIFLLISLIVFTATPMNLENAAKGYELKNIDIVLESDISQDLNSDLPGQYPKSLSKFNLEVSKCLVSNLDNKSDSPDLLIIDEPIASSSPSFKDALNVDNIIREIDIQNEKVIEPIEHSDGTNVGEKIETHMKSDLISEGVELSYSEKSRVTSLLEKNVDESLSQEFSDGIAQNEENIAEEPLKTHIGQVVENVGESPVHHQTLLKGINNFSPLNLSDQVIGYGSHGTVVYLGSFEGRPVAVKRLLLDFYSSATLEVRILQEADTHPNVIRYFCSEMSKNFLFIALELCAGSMYDAINYHNLDFFSKRQLRDNSRSSFELMTKIKPKRVLYQLALGLHHLHQMKLVHRDIKPQNILLALPVNYIKNMKSRGEFSSSAAIGNISRQIDEHPDSKKKKDFFNPFNDLDVENISGEPRVVISDFGLSRILQGEESSFFNTMHFGSPDNNNNNHNLHGAGGTVGWRAPECFEHSITNNQKYSNRKTESSFSNNGVSSNEYSKLSINGNESKKSNHSVQSNTESGTYSNGRVFSGVGSEKKMSVLSHEASGDNCTPTPNQISSYDSVNENSPSNVSNIVSTEDINGQMLLPKMTRKMDIFSLGCVYYYFLTRGEHPFGDRYNREQNILENNFDLSLLDEMNYYNFSRGSEFDFKNGGSKAHYIIDSSVEAKDLIAHMIQRDPKYRPSTSSILVHPYFWSASKRLLFIQDVSDKLESYAKLIKTSTFSSKSNDQSSNRPNSIKPENKTPNKAQNKKTRNSGRTNVGSKSLKMSSDNCEKEYIFTPEESEEIKSAKLILDGFEMHSEYVLESAPGNDGSSGGWSRVGALGWDKKLDRYLRNDLGSFRKYNFYKLRDLLRVIRNKKHHYQDLDQDLQESLGSVPEGFYSYFESRFPNLLLHCYYFVLENDQIRRDSIFSQYFTISQ